MGILMGTTKHCKLLIRAQDRRDITSARRAHSLTAVLPPVWKGGQLTASRLGGKPGPLFQTI